MILAERGNGRFTTFSFKLLGASQDFPTVSCNITLGSGVGVTFASLTPQEFTTFVETLTRWCGEAMAVVPSLERQAETIKQAKTEWEAKVAALRMMQQQAEPPDEPMAPSGDLANPY